MRSDLKLARRRLLSLFVDWLVWAYLSYGSFSLHYLYTSPTLIWRPEEKFVLPPLSGLWEWLVAALIVAELALLCRAFGVSVGQRALGLRLQCDGRHESRGETAAPCSHLTIWRRGLYFVLSHASILTLGVGTLLNPQHPWHERLAGVRLSPAPPKVASGHRPRWYLTSYGILVICVAALTLALGWRVVDVQLGTLIRDARKPVRMWRGLTNPDFTYLIRPDPRAGDSLIGALVESLFMGLLATVLGAFVAFPLSFFGARNIAGRSPLGLGLYAFIRGLFNVFRSVESIFWASIFAIWVGFGPFAGALALFIHTIAALGKLYSEQVEHIDPGPVEAATAAGGSRLQVIKQAVIPQIIPPFLAFTLYRWDINLRMTTVLALVGGGGIGRLFFDYKDDLEWHLVGAVVVCFAIAVWMLDYVSGWVREKIT